MSLNPYQTMISQNKLYAVGAAYAYGSNTSQNSGAQITPNIEIYGGNAGDVHGSQILPDDPLTEMPVIMSALNGIKVFDFVPNYIYVHPTGSAITSIILSGINAVSVDESTAKNQIITYVKASLHVVENASAKNQILTYVAAPLNVI